ncbi:MAG: UvrD-helicase domain-containing protein, partial [Treponema sp.]|nr:UvrD-helicase domain-containing protein [Treponema sp.]
MKNTCDYLDLLSPKLDDEQNKVCKTFSNAVVGAGAGSGKTEVLARRFAHLVMEYDDIGANNILTLTFTKKAAGEMYNRIYKTLKTFANNENVPERQRNNAKNALEDFSNVHIQTLDSYCSYIVRQAANRYGIKPDFSQGDES